MNTTPPGHSHCPHLLPSALPQVFRELQWICSPKKRLNIINILLPRGYKFIMRPGKQKKDDSQDEFEEIKEELETLNARRVESPPNYSGKSHPRMQYMAEKHKLGLITNLQPVEMPAQGSRKKETHVAIGKIIKVGSAIFRSNFESGSIGCVELIGVNSFRITLDNETNSNRGNTWFDFIVEGVKGEASFTIGGFRKKTSLYSEGMKICCREVGQNGKWKRGGTQVSYVKDCSAEDGAKTYEVKFNYNFKLTEHNSVEFAYGFPYGFTRLQELLAFLHAKVKVQTLASSFQGKDLPLINLGNLSSKQVIVLSARVHPGETVSSLMMQGFLREIVSDSDSSRYLRERFLFKIMPMINVDGVRHGNFRFSSSGVDLNRRWKNPTEEHHPQIYYLKQMMLRESKTKKIRMFIDMHGHSRKKNVFFYGCCQEGEKLIDNFQPKAFPFLMGKLHDAFNYHDCSFTIQPDKEGTARVTLWNELKINEIFTLEASFCSSAKGNNYLEADYQKMGQKLSEGIALYFYEPSAKGYPQLAKGLALREKSYSELRTDASLLKQGNEENAGSDSEPEKGERADLKHHSQHPHQPLKGPAYNVQVHEPIKHGSESLKNHLQLPHFEQLAVKHKSQADVSNSHERIELQQVRELFPPHGKLETIKTDYDSQHIPQKNHEPIRNIRVHHSTQHTTKGNTTPVTKLGLYNDDEILNEEELQRKDDKRIIAPFQNTQYRRIKHMMQQKLSSKVNKECPQVLVQSNNTRKIEVEQHHQGVVPRFYANTPFKRRKSSLEIFYNKPNKSVGKATPNPKEGQKVFCRGKQIMF